MISTQGVVDEPGICFTILEIGKWPGNQAGGIGLALFHLGRGSRVENRGTASRPPTAGTAARQGMNNRASSLFRRTTTRRNA